LSDDVLWERAQIELKQGKTEKAIETLTELSGFLGADLLIDRALFELAKIYDYDLNNSEKAMEYYQQVCSEHADSILASQARARFRTLRGDELYN
jgi:tetratricopeptide (TPR) repeat protein